MITILADTTHVVAHTPAENTGYLISLATLALAIGGILVRGGILIGEHKAVARRVEDVEKAQRNSSADAITRHELDARLAGFDEKLDSMKDRLDDAVSTMREVLKR